MRAIDLSGSQFLAVRLRGRPLTLKRQIRDCDSLCRQQGASQVDLLDAVEATKIWRSLADFGWDEGSTPVLAGRASLLPSRLPEIAETLERSGTSRGLSPAAVSHPAHGTVLVSWFADRKTPSGDAAIEVVRETIDAVHQAGGHMIIERCPLDVKSRIDVWDDVRGPLAVMHRLKEQYDPKGILNPGRFVGGI